MVVPRRLAIIAAAFCGTVILVGCGIAVVGGFNLSDIKNVRALQIGDYVAGDVDKGSSQAVLGVADGATADASQMLASETPPEQVAMANVPDVPNGGVEEAISSSETPHKSSYNNSPITPETRPVQIAAVSLDDVVHGDFAGVVNAETPP